MENTKERRSAPRFRPTGDVLRHVSLDLETQVVKLSTAGMEVEVAMLVEIGSRHRFSLVLAGEELIVDGTVRNCFSGPALGSPTFTLGVAFDGVDPETCARLEQFVASRADRG